MNILILVFTMLSLLTIMTYTRLQTFLDDAGIRLEYERYMVTTERQSIDELEERRYKSAVIKTSSGGKPAKGSSEDAAEKEMALAKLNIFPLLKKPAADGADQRAASNVATGKVSETIGILDRLITIVYGQQRFFQDATKDHPNLAEELIAAMAKAAADPICELKFTNVRDLANLVFDDSSLREVFYKMLKGEAPVYRPNKEGKDVMTHPGYPSLLDYLSVQKTPTKIRIWLARKALLQAIFRDPQDIIERRNELYQYLKDDVFTAKAADADFGRFSDPVSTDVDLTMLDFKTSKTRPPSN